MQVAIVDPITALRGAIAEVTSNVGLESGSWEDLVDWLEVAEASEDTIVVVSLLTPPDFERLATLAEQFPRVRFIALVDPPYPEVFGQAIRAGAASVGARNAAAPDLALVIDTCERGWTLLPHLVASELARAGASSYRAVNLNDQEVGWLRALANDSTVAHLAESAGYSQRVSDPYRNLPPHGRREPHQGSGCRSPMGSP
jgi:DNA-binding NarL/FixJ family response regulator